MLSRASLQLPPVLRSKEALPFPCYASFYHTVVKYLFEPGATELGTGIVNLVI